MNQSPTVFLVDDDEAVRHSLTLYLQSEDFTVEAFASALEFLDAYSPDRVGCLVLDISLPGMNGLMLQEKLAAEKFLIPIIFITGYGDVSLSVTAMKAGAFDLIEKPVDLERLCARIHEAIRWDTDRRENLPDAQAQETLHALGDAVITTDATGTVKYLNPIAEELTGWSLKKALGRPIEKIFNIVDEQSRKPTENLVTQSLLHERVSRREEHVVLIRKDGREFFIEESVSPIRNRSGEIQGAVMVFKDVSEQRRAVKELTRHAMHDPLTGLVNRREFEKRLERALTSSKTQSAKHTLCFIDLDQFKTVNDVAGHSAGDELLRQVTALLTVKVRDRDTLARLGGDEFGLLLNNCPTEKAHEIVDELIAEIQGFGFVVDGQLFKVGASVGLVPITYSSPPGNELLHQADMACYTAKQMGRNRAYTWRDENIPLTSPLAKMQRAKDLSTALSENHFLLYRQPVVSLLSEQKQPIMQEILIRLVDTGGDIVLPNSFIPTAERNGLMSAIDHWVIHSALHRHREIGITNTEISINLSGSSLNDDAFLDYVRLQLRESRIHPERVCFEISETTAVHNLNQTQQFIKETKQLGCRFALDNFGSGLSSFSYLKALGVDYVKIDGSYVRDMLETPFHYSMVEAISKIGHSLGIRVIAEWAESQAVVTCLRSLGIDYAQGTALFPPEPFEAANSNQKITHVTQVT